MMDETIGGCYEEIEKMKIIPEIEPFEFDVVKAVDAYRQYWKPEKVQVVLLAESHVKTKAEEFKIELKEEHLRDLKKLNPTKEYPKNYVRFVYCLGYGENDILSNHVNNNRGTWQYWKIFAACASHESCEVLKTKTKRIGTRMENKIGILKKLMERGIWLVDASIVAINNEKSEKKKKIMQTCWEKYIKPLLTKLNPKWIICIGTGVKNSLDDNKLEEGLSKFCRKRNVKLEQVPQPQTHIEGGYSPYLDKIGNIVNSVQNL